MVINYPNKSFYTIHHQVKNKSIFVNKRSVKYLIDLPKKIVNVAGVSTIVGWSYRDQCQKKTAFDLETRSKLIKEYCKNYKKASLEDRPPEILQLQKRDFATIRAHTKYTESSYSIFRDIKSYYNNGTSYLDNLINVEHSKLKKEGVENLNSIEFSPKEDLTLFIKDDT